jgi:hypothetical protein
MGMPLRAIGRQVGLSHQGVADRITAAITELVTPAAEEYRQLEAARLDDLTRSAYQVLATADTGELKLKAVDRLERLSVSRRKLLGLDAPVALDVALEQRLDLEADVVAGALAAALDVLDLDEEQREAALGAAQALLLGQEPPAPLVRRDKEQGAADEQARIEREFRALMTADGVDADALLADLGDEDQDDEDDDDR